MNPIIKKLYTREELEGKIEEYMKDYEKHESKNEYEYMTFACGDIATLYEILEDKEKSNYYYERIVEIWKAHPGKFVDLECISALSRLQRSEEALKIVLSNPKSWGVGTLAILYEELGRKEEAIIIYSGLAHCSYELCRVCSPFWKPHYLRKAADLCEKAKKFDRVSEYTKAAVEEWEKNKDNIENTLYVIEEAWLNEEGGYIYEKAGQFDVAMKYYQKTQSKYELAYTDEHVTSTEVTYVEFFSDWWSKYYEFFLRQIPDFRFIHFRYEHCRKNDYRRITYRLLNLEEKMRK